jgi:hypothetical protein
VDKREATQLHAGGLSKGMAIFTPLNEKRKGMTQPRIFLLLLFLFLSFSYGKAETDRYRLTWREDPATTMVIGWDQVSGGSPVVYLDETDHGRSFSKYRFSKGVDQVYQQKGMNNHFVRLRGLKPDTEYFFVIKDSDSVSERMSFKTAPASSTRLSIIAGGDSRNHRDVRRNANAIVAKLRPHCVLFSGDMIRIDNDIEWVEWFDDWQATIATDGRVTPIIVAQGNHEKNGTLAYLFDIPNPAGYYALSLGGNLLRVYTLNTEIPAGGPQKEWLERDLNANNRYQWKIAQYHRAMRPHTSDKKPNLDAYSNWAQLFFDHGFRLVIESDAHLSKTTWPIQPTTAGDHEEGFIQDNPYGTVYTGEGGWGAPLREADNPRKWTRAHSEYKFNQFKWIFIDRSLIQMRTVIITRPDMIETLTDKTRFKEDPQGLALWNPPTGAVVNIYPQGIADPDFEEPPQDEFVVMSPPDMEMTDFSAVQVGQNIEVNFGTQHEPAGMTFEVQRSLDGGNTYQTVSSVPGKGSGKGSQTYRSVDLNTAPNAVQGRVTYRLRRVFGNGESDFYYPNKSISEDVGNWERLPKLVPQAGQLKIAYQLEGHSHVRIRMINPQRQEVLSIDLPDQAAGRYLKTIDLSAVPRGRYLIVVRADNLPLKRFRVAIN